MGLFSKKKKTQTVTQQENNQPTAEKTFWECPKCGTHNQLTSRSCKDCGYYK